MKSTQDVPSDQQHFLNVVAPSGRSIEPCVFSVAQGIADQAVSYAESRAIPGAKSLRNLDCQTMRRGSGSVRPSSGCEPQSKRRGIAASNQRCQERRNTIGHETERRKE